MYKLDAACVDQNGNNTRPQATHMRTCTHAHARTHAHTQRVLCRPGARAGQCSNIMYGMWIDMCIVMCIMAEGSCVPHVACKARYMCIACLMWGCDYVKCCLLHVTCVLYVCTCMLHVVFMLCECCMCVGCYMLHVCCMLHMCCLYVPCCAHNVCCMHVACYILHVRLHFCMLLLAAY